jgi:type IV secretion system protein TrbF
MKAFQPTTSDLPDHVGILTIVVQIPRNADRLRSNPLGIYVNAISWSRELGQ